MTSGNGQSLVEGNKEEVRGSNPLAPTPSQLHP